MDAALYSRGRYSRIPDHLSEREDVVLIEKNESRIALPRPVFVFWALIGVLGIASWTVGVPGAFEGVFMDSASENSGVVVYQSSISGDRFLNMSVALFAARNILISALAFGNSFLSSSDTVGSIFIDEGERYQVRLAVPLSSCCVWCDQIFAGNYGIRRCFH